MASNQAIYIVFNGTWYRADVAKETGVYKIKGSTSKISSKFMGVFS